MLTRFYLQNDRSTLEDVALSKPFCTNSKCMNNKLIPEEVLLIYQIRGVNQHLIT